MPRVSVVVVHYRHVELLAACLAAIEADGYPETEVLVVANSPLGGSQVELQQRFPEARFIERAENDGYGAACNEGAAETSGDYLLFLNNDIEIAPGCLEGLVATAENDPRIALAQPKIRSAQEPQRFDYAGAAGGLMDRLGYTFARGRIFDTIESDDGQYDEPCDIFWATGAALFARRSAFDAAGGFEPAFFLHMEEIDLAWRLHAMGQRVVAVPTTEALHVGSPSLGRDSRRQMFLNHRNNLIVLFRNYRSRQLLTLLPLRLVLELLAAVYSLFDDGGRRALAIVQALFDLLRRPSWLFALRRRVAESRDKAVLDPLDRLYRGSIVVDYFVRGRRTVSELSGFGGGEPVERSS